MRFRDDYGVYVCPHVFGGHADVLLAVRDFDGSWQFLCGAEHDTERETPCVIGVSHLTEIDDSIHELTEMTPGQVARRQSKNVDWTIGDLSEEQDD